eukprot:SAG31_NODE_3865_length_3800_cov_25.525662_1_plen_69_part_00
MGTPYASAHASAVAPQLPRTLVHGLYPAELYVQITPRIVVVNGSTTTAAESVKIRSSLSKLLDIGHFD